MFFLLDKDEDWVYIYIKGCLVKIPIIDINKEISNEKTWYYNKSLEQCSNIKYGYLFSKGLSINEICPTFIKKDLLKLQNTIDSCYKTSEKVGLYSSIISDIVPERILLDYYKILEEVCEYSFSNLEEPKNYNFLLELTETLERIKEYTFNLNEETMKNISEKLELPIWEKYEENKYSTSPAYRVFSTVTGRIHFEPGVFPLMNLKKEARVVLEPNFDAFIEIDFNGIDIRSALFLAGIPQPQIDVHDWNIQNVFGENTTRKDAKKSFFSWLYNPAKSSPSLEKVYKLDKVIGRYYNNGIVTNPFDRVMEADDFHSLNYLCQSTSADVCLRTLVYLEKNLRNKRSKVALTIQDSFLIDLCEEELDFVKELIYDCKRTDIGMIPVNVSIGKNYGEMEKIGVF